MTLFALNWLKVAVLSIRGTSVFFEQPLLQNRFKIFIKPKTQKRCTNENFTILRRKDTI